MSDGDGAMRKALGQEAHEWLLGLSVSDNSRDCAMAVSVLTALHALAALSKQEGASEAEPAIPPAGGEALKSCPFCGSTTIEIHEHLEDGGPHAECVGCGVKSDFYFTEAELRAAWNRRALPVSAAEPAIPDEAREAAQRIIDTDEGRSTESVGVYLMRDAETVARALLAAYGRAALPVSAVPETDIHEAREAARVAMQDTIDLLCWLDRRGGLGYEKHERIRSAIADLMAARALLSSSGGGE